MDIHSIGEATEESLQAVKPANPDDQLVVQFEHALTSGGQVPSGGVLSQISDAAAQISQVKQSLRAKMAAPGEISAGALMEMQYSLMQINLQEELIAKTVGRLTQNVETLMKTQ